MIRVCLQWFWENRHASYIHCTFEKSQFNSGYVETINSSIKSRQSSMGEGRKVAFLAFCLVDSREKLAVQDTIAPFVACLKKIVLEDQFSDFYCSINDNHLRSVNKKYYSSH